MNWSEYNQTLKARRSLTLWLDRQMNGARRATTSRRGRCSRLGVDAQTVEIRAIEVTGNSVGDAPMLPELLVQPPSEERLVSVCAEAKRS